MTKPDRKTYIGSGDAKEILSGSWHDLWMIKTGRSPEPDLSDQFNVQLGVHTEQFHLDWTTRRMKEAGEADEIPNQREKTYRPTNPKHDFIACHVDAMIHAPKYGPCPLEAKHSSGSRSTEDLLEFYMPQLQHELYCTGAAVGVISVIQGNLEPERLWVGRSEEWLDTYLAACTRFWKYVKADKPPPFKTPATVIEPKIIDAIPINGMTKRNMDGDNTFINFANDMIENEEAMKKYEAAKTGIKGLMAPTEAELYSKLVTLKRDKRGAIRMTFHNKE